MFVEGSLRAVLRAKSACATFFHRRIAGRAGSRYGS
jgi:hypothetical protein